MEEGDIGLQIVPEILKTLSAIGWIKKFWIYYWSLQSINFNYND